MFFIKRHETEKFGVEVELDFSDGAVAVFGDDEFGDISRDEVVFVLDIIIRAMEKHDHVGVLLDRARFAEVGEDGTRIITTGDGAGELSEGDDRDFQFAGELFQAAGDFRDFLDTVAGVAVGALEEL